MSSSARKQIVNIGLIVVAIGLVISVIATSGRVTTSEQAARENNLLASYREDDLQKLVLDYRSRHIVLEKKAGDAGDATWLITAPVHEEADVVAMQKLLGSLEFATVVRRIKPSEVNAAAFGLDAPQLVFTIEMGAITYHLRLGKEAASPAGAVYAEVTGDGAPKKGVVILSRDLVKELSVDVADLRGQEIMPYLSASLSKLTLEGAGGTRSLKRTESGRFRFDGMAGNLRVNREALDRIFLQFARTKAEKFIERGSAEKALANGPVVTIRMTPEEPKQPRGIVAVGGKCPNGEGVVALRREPDAVAACVPESVMPALTSSAESLIDRGLFSLRRDEVESLRIQLSGKRLELERSGEGFTLRAPEKADVDLEAGNQRIDAILEIQGELLQTPNTAELGLQNPAGEVKLGSAPESSGKIREETVVLAASAKDGSIVVLRKEDGAVLKLSRDSARVLTPDSTLVRSHKLLEFSERDLEWLSIKHAGKEQRFAHRTDGSYELQTPKGFAVDPGLVSDVVDGLATLSTDRWLADQDDGSFGLQKPNLEVHLSIDMHDAGSNGERVLRIGDTTGGGAAATIDGTPGVFVFPKRVVNALEIPLIDRSAFVVDGATTQRIELEREGRKIVLEKQGNEFVDRSPHAELSKGRIQQIIDALASMRAEAAVHTGPELPSEGLNRPQLRVFAESQTKGGEPPKTMRYRVGAADSWRSMTVVYARADGVDASFVIARSKIDEILDAL